MQICLRYLLINGERLRFRRIYSESYNAETREITLEQLRVDVNDFSQVATPGRSK